MGEIFDYCQGLLTDDNLEGIFISQNENNNSRINRRRSSVGGGMKNPFIPINSKEENNLSQCISTNNLKYCNKIINYDEYKKINNNKEEYINGIVENELVNSITKMTKIIETLENKNQILEKEKNNIQNENIKLLKEIEIYKKTISKLKNKNKIYFSSDKSEIINSTDKYNNNNNEQIKIIFLFKNNKKNEENKENQKNNGREEIIAYKYEMFIEVKLRLLNLKHLDPGDIKACYHNSKEINDWFTLEELNFDNITYVNCEFV